MIALMRSVMCDLMPRSAELPGIMDTDVTGFLRAMRRDADPLYWFALTLGAWVFVLSPILTVYVPLPSFLLPARLRARHAERATVLRTYVLRQAVLLVRLTAGMCWGADPKVRARFALAPYPADPGSYRA